MEKGVYTMGEPLSMQLNLHIEDRMAPMAETMTVTPVMEDMILEGAVFRTLRKAVPSLRFEGPVGEKPTEAMAISRMRQVRDLWHGVYDAMLGRAGANGRPPLTLDVVGGVDGAASFLADSVDVLNAERARDNQDALTANQVRQAIMQTPDGADCERLANGLLRTLALGLYHEAHGAHTRAEITSSSEVRAQLAENALSRVMDTALYREQSRDGQPFTTAMRQTFERSRANFEAMATAGFGEIELRDHSTVPCHWLPLSPLDPAFADRECMIMVGGNQLLFMDCGDAQSLAMDAIANAARTDLIDPRARRTAVAVAKWDEEGDEVEALVNDSLGRGFSSANIDDFKNAGRIRSLRVATTADALGVSSLLRELPSKTEYRRVTSTLTAWNDLIDSANATSPVNQRDLSYTYFDEQGSPVQLRFSVSAPNHPVSAHDIARRAIDDARHNFLGNGLAMVKAADRFGYDVDFEADDYPGQLRMRIKDASLTARILDKPFERESSGLLMSELDRARFTGKIRMQSADNHLLNVYDAASGNCVTSDNSAKAANTDRINARDIIDIYDDPELHEEMLRHALGIRTSEDVMRESGRNGSVLTTDGRRYVTGFSSNAASNRVFLRNINRTVTDDHGQARSRAFVVVSEVGTTRAQNTAPFTPGVRPSGEQEMIDYDENGEPYYLMPAPEADDASKLIVDASTYLPRIDNEGHAVVAPERVPYRAVFSYDNEHNIIDATPVFDDANEDARLMRPTRVYASDVVRGMVHAARVRLRDQLGVDELVETAEAYMRARGNGDDLDAIEMPSLDRNGTLADTDVALWREEIWRMLMGSANELHMPLGGEAGTIDRQHNFTSAVIECDRDQYGNPLDRSAYARRFEKAALDSYLGTYEPSYDEFTGTTHRFNLQHVFAYQANDSATVSRRLTDAVSSIIADDGIEHFDTVKGRYVYAQEEVASPDVVEGTHDVIQLNELSGATDCDDPWAVRMLDRVTPFDAGSAVSLADIEAEDNPSQADQYRAHIMGTVRDKLLEMGVHFSTDEQQALASEIQMDATGLVRYPMVVTKTFGALANGANGKAEDVRTAYHGSMYLGRFAVPERTAGALRSASPNALSQQIYYTRSQLRVLPADEAEGDRAARTRLKSFDQHLDEVIRRQVEHDVCSLMPSKTAHDGFVVNSCDSIQNVYTSEWVAQSESSFDYDRERAEAAAFEADPEIFARDGEEAIGHEAEPLWLNDQRVEVGDHITPETALTGEEGQVLLDSDGHAWLRAAHNPQPNFTSEMLRARELTRLAEADYPSSFTQLTDVSRAGLDTVGMEERFADSDHSVSARADGRDMVQLSPAERALFDVYGTTDSREQTTKHTLNVDVQVAADGSLSVADPENPVGMSATSEHLPYLENDAWNRGRMAHSGDQNALAINETRVATFGGGGWLQDDGIIISKQYAERHQIYGGNGVRRPIKIQDKFADEHGNKGVVAMIFDTDMTAEEARAMRDNEADPVHGESWYRMWELFKANTDENGVCHLDMAMNNVSFVSRQNAGSLHERLDAVSETLRVPYDAEGNFTDDVSQMQTVPAGITTMRIQQQNHLADQHNYENNSKMGWQHVYANMDRCKKLVSAAFAVNDSGYAEVNETLAMALGAQLSSDGHLKRDLDMSDVDARSVLTLQEVDYHQSNDPAGLTTVSGITAAETGTTFATEKRRRHCIGELDVDRTVAATMAAMNAGAGVLRVPFALSWPEMSVSTEGIDPAVLEANGFDPEARTVTLGGSTLPVAGAGVGGQDRTGHTLYEMPLPSLRQRVRKRDSDRTAGFDDSQTYETIVRAAATFERNANLVDAYETEMHRLEDELARRIDAVGGVEQATPDQLQQIVHELNDGTPFYTNPDVAIGRRMRGFGRELQNSVLTEQGRNGKKQATLLKGVKNLGLRPETDEQGNHIPTIPLIEAYRSAIQSLQKDMGNAEDRANKAFRRLVAKNRDRLLDDNGNMIKKSLCKTGLKPSKYAVWSANPDLDVDEILIGRDVADALGIKYDEVGVPTNTAADDRLLLWRNPILRAQCNVAVRYRVTDQCEGIMVNPALAPVVSGDFDGDHVSVYWPQDPEVLDEIRRELPVERVLLDRHVAPDVRMETNPETGETREIKSFGFSVQTGLDAKVGARFCDSSVTEKLDAALEEINVAQREFDATVSEARAQYPINPTDDFAAIRENRERYLAVESEAYAKRDAVMREKGLPAVNEYLHAATPESVGRDALSATDIATLMSGVAEATVNHGIKGKAGQLSHLMSGLGLVPADDIARERIAAIQAGEKVTLESGAVVSSLSEYLAAYDFADFRGTEPPYAVDGTTYVTVRDLESDQVDVFDADTAKALSSSWHELREQESNSTCVAMNAKTSITGRVGVAPQIFHADLPYMHEMTCDLTEPVYQLSLDFKLDGADALSKMPWVQVWTDVMRSMTLYEGLDVADGITSGAAVEDFKRLNTWHPGDPTPAEDSKIAIPTPGRVKHQLYNIYDRMGQDVNHAIIDQLVDHLTVQTDIGPCVMGLDDYGQQYGSTLGAIAFDTSAEQSALKQAIVCNRALGVSQNDIDRSVREMADGTKTTLVPGGKLAADDELNIMLPASVRHEMGVEMPTEQQQALSERKVTALGRRLAARGDAEATTRSRGLASALNTGEVRVAIFTDPDAASVQNGVGDVTERVCDDIKAKLALEAGSMSGDVAVVPVEIPVDATSAYDAYTTMMNDADLVVLVGNGEGSQVGVTVGDEMQRVDALDVDACASEAHVATLEICKPEPDAEGIPVDGGDATLTRYALHRYDEATRPSRSQERRAAETHARGCDSELNEQGWRHALATRELTLAVCGPDFAHGLTTGEKSISKNKDMLESFYGRMKTPGNPLTTETGALKKVSDEFKAVSRDLEGVMRNLLDKAGLKKLTIVTTDEPGAAAAATWTAGRLAAEPDYKDRVNVVVKQATRDVDEKLWPSETKGGVRNFFSQRLRSNLYGSECVSLDTPGVRSVARGASTQQLDRMRERARCRAVDAADMVVVCGTGVAGRMNGPEAEPMAAYAAAQEKNVIALDTTARMTRQMQGGDMGPHMTTVYHEADAFKQVSEPEHLFASKNERARHLAEQERASHEATVSVEDPVISAEPEQDTVQDAAPMVSSESVSETATPEPPHVAEAADTLNTVADTAEKKDEPVPFSEASTEVMSPSVMVETNFDDMSDDGGDDTPSF